jgi:hypothetical protein
MKYNTIYLSFITKIVQSCGMMVLSCLVVCSAAVIYFCRQVKAILVYLRCDAGSQPGSSVSIVSGYGLDDRGSIPSRGKMIFPLATVSRPALGPTQPPIQWVPGALSLGLKRGRGVTLTTHPYLVSRLKMSRIYTSSPPKGLRGVLWVSFSFLAGLE